MTLTHRCRAQPQSATGSADRLLTTSASELAHIVGDGTYSQVCSPWHGPTDVCSYDEKNLNSPAAAQGPFLMYGPNSGAGSDRVAIYRCITAAGGHFFSPQSNCEGQKVEALLGYASSARSSQTGRSLRRCLSNADSSHYHMLDAPCLAGDHEDGLYGFVV